MPRIRTIKPDFWQHPKVTRVSRDARLYFLGLLNEADDAGRLRYSGKRLAGVIFPDDDDVSGAEIDQWTDELEAVGLVLRYTIDGAPLLLVVGFTEHQRINRPSPSRLPAPCTEPSREAHDILSEPSHPERNREQGTGKGTIAIAARSREPDLLWDAICDCWQIDTAELTDPERARLNKAAELLRDIDADPNEIPKRRATYRTRYRDAADTPMAIAGRWAELRQTATAKPEPGLVLPPSRHDTCPACDSSLLACECVRTA